MFVPASLAGAPLWGAVGISARQAAFYDQLSFNAPNIWAIVQRIPAVATIALTGLALAAAIGAAAWLVTRMMVLQLEAPRLATAAVPSPLLVVALLPRMHERYFFLAEVLALVWASGA
jgi:hypothetical protein